MVCACNARELEKMTEKEIEVYIRSNEDMIKTKDGGEGIRGSKRGERKSERAKERKRERERVDRER
jgi:hypothetical protein